MRGQGRGGGQEDDAEPRRDQLAAPAGMEQPLALGRGCKASLIPGWGGGQNGYKRGEEGHSGEIHR